MGDLAGSLALTGLVGDLEGAELERRNTEGTNELANLEATDLEVLVLLGDHHLVLGLHGVLGHHKRVLLGEKGLLLIGETIDLEAGASKLLVSRLELHGSLLLLEHLLVTLESETVNLTLESLARGLPLLQDTLSGLELGLKNHLILQVALKASRLGLAEGTSELLLGELGEGLHGKLLTLEGLLSTDTGSNLLLIPNRAGHTHLELSGLGVNLLLHELGFGGEAGLVTVLALAHLLNLELEELLLGAGPCQLAGSLFLASLDLLLDEFGLKLKTLTTRLGLARVDEFLAELRDGGLVTLELAKDNSELTLGLALSDGVLGLLCDSFRLGTSESNLLGLSLLGLGVLLATEAGNLVGKSLLLVGGLVASELGSILFLVEGGLGTFVLRESLVKGSLLLGESHLIVANGLGLGSLGSLQTLDLVLLLDHLDTLSGLGGLGSELRVGSLLRGLLGLVAGNVGGIVCRLALLDLGSELTLDGIKLLLGKDSLALHLLLKASNGALSLLQTLLGGHLLLLRLSHLVLHVVELDLEPQLHALTL